MVYYTCLECGQEKVPNDSPHHKICAFRKYHYENKLPKLADDVKRINYLIQVMKSIVDYKSDTKLYSPFDSILAEAEKEIGMLIEIVQTSLIKKYIERKTLKQSA